MKIKSNMKIKYNDENSAEISHKTLKVDNECFIQSKINGNELEFKIDSDSLGSFLNTVDDLIASEIVVEKIINTSTNEK
ncbi:hypothetical protein BGI41_07975 [Methanobrevibacter sp. 87.7]|uniref:KEOPS complex subunit Pcc1 n=1 Tax=Methanobrevibacter sp. 87.7 TaxID=387957 RepID=UPI000B508F4F|nr:KEOPS complex subunit Pcc1 [Methanobrevibacter sp. 87.7]OWT32379.1 hypothetical protein BGI41_07975 [Methanobrevibacter sp. 87.7]